jgi:hypothetical protein
MKKILFFVLLGTVNCQWIAKFDRSKLKDATPKDVTKRKDVDKKDVKLKDVTKGKDVDKKDVKLEPEVPKPLENTTDLCQDEKDNDGDKLIDCQDPDCCTPQNVCRGNIYLSEVLYDPKGNDEHTELEWIELVNLEEKEIYLTCYRIGAGEINYLATVVLLEGKIPAKGCFTICEKEVQGCDLTVNFNPDLPNGKTNGIGLFDQDVTGASCPKDWVVYGKKLGGNFKDEDCKIITDEQSLVKSEWAGRSIERVSIEPRAWQEQKNPSLGDCSSLLPD